MKCLILSYYFPPSNQIGARRWGTLAEYLVKKGVEVDVLCSNRELNLLNPTFQQVQGVQVYRFDADLPFFLSNRKVTTTFDKIRYKLSEILGRINVKGNHYDTSKYAARSIENALDERLRCKHYDVVICTIAPFHMALIAAQLTQKYGERLWVDYRDPWSIASAYGFQLISKQKRFLEEKNESLLLDIAWKVSMPSTEMMKNYSESFPVVVDKLVHLPHGYDSSIRRRRRSEPYQKFIYGGTLYEDIDGELEQFQQFLSNSGSQAQFFLLNSQRILSKYSFDSIEVKAAISEDLFYKKCESYDVFVAIVPEKYKDYISTKYFQLFHMGIPILHIGPKGKLSEFITNNEFGVSFTKSEEISIEPLKCMNPSFEAIEGYSHEELTEELLHQISSQL